MATFRDVAFWGIFSDREKRDCRQRCRSLFPEDKSLDKGCRNACDSGMDIRTRQDYLSLLGPEAALMNYGYTVPDEDGNVANPCDLPGYQNRPECQPANNTSQYLIWFGVLAVAVLLYFYLKSRS